jgi:integrase
MAIEKLTDLKIKRAKQPGYYNDGGGLYLRIGPSGNKHWVFRYKVNSRTREMGLGPLYTITLAEARETTREARKLRLKGLDPIEERKKARHGEQLSAAKTMTFAECGAAYIAAHRSEWSSAKHAKQWVTTLDTYVYPKIGELPVGAIDEGLVLKVLEPIWETTPETASRVRGRIASVLDWATVRKYRQGANPAAWRGNLEHALAKQDKRQKPHHAALPYDALAEFMTQLRAQDSMSALALEFTVLTCARTDETLGAVWGEIDFLSQTWTIPAERMKGRREHRVPLCRRSLEILQKLYDTRSTDLVFTRSRGRKLSPDTMRELLGRMGYGQITVHGFRATFADFATERTSAAREARELALAHFCGTAVELAYRRGDMFKHRRDLAQLWGDYCDARAIPEVDAVRLTA